MRDKHKTLKDFLFCFYSDNKTFYFKKELFFDSRTAIYIFILFLLFSKYYQMIIVIAIILIVTAVKVVFDYAEKLVKSRLVYRNKWFLKLFAHFETVFVWLLLWNESLEVDLFFSHFFSR